MKRVSFKVAKAIKEVGYPQKYDSPCYVTEDCIKKYDMDSDGDMPIIGEREYNEGQYIDRFSYRDKECGPPHCYAPTYIEVWLWLWREKKKCIDIIFSYDEDNWTFMQSPSPCDCGLYSDPEEAIIAAIEYLVDNNIIK